MLSTLRRRGYPEETLPIGTTYTITQSGTWECPATGTWQVELHGGGGGAARATGNRNYSISGGGSGELYTSTYKKGASISVTIGAGGSGATSSYVATATDGGTTKFGDLSISGGGGSWINYSSVYIGPASGSIATSGNWERNNDTNIVPDSSGGYGNKNNTTQTYGNGGSVLNNAAKNGYSGAVILTYLGK